jgi:serine phosphatase RsbU (regulator of sigma subunit)
MRSRIYYLLLLLTWPTWAWAQNQAKLDSLLNLLKTAEDTNRVLVLNQLCWVYRGSDYNKAIEYGRQAQKLAIELDYPLGLANSLSFIGVVKRNIGDYPEAMENFFDALRIAEEYQLKRELAYSYNNIGDIFKLQGDDIHAIENTQKAIALFKEMDDLRGISYAYLRMGELYQNQQNYTQALQYFQQTLGVRRKLQDLDALETSMNRVGNIYRLLGRYDSALHYLNRSLTLSQNIKDKTAIANNQADIALTYANLGQIDTAIAFAKNALSLAEEVGSNRHILKSSEILSDIFARQGNFEQAYQYHKLLLSASKRVVNERNTALLDKTQTDYRLEKKQEEIEGLNKEKEYETVLRYALSAILLLGGGILAVLYRSNKQRQNTNRILTAQYEAMNKQREETAAIAENLRIAHQELSTQKALIEHKNEDISASINYARRIQTSMLPPDEKIQRIFPSSFIFYRPRDIVSGDFYWVAEVGDKSLIICADCTGHGVPGGFMSMIGMNLISEMIKVLGVNRPEVILSGLNMGIRNVLNQSVTQNRDGMDASVCVIDRQKKTLEFAGASQDLVYIVHKQENELVHIRGDRTSIGGLESKPSFTKHTLQIDAPITFYLSTDGYPDQHGGPHNRKIMKKGFREFLQQLTSLPIESQHQALDQHLVQWMGTNKQVDDILVIGVRLEL